MVGVLEIDTAQFKYEFTIKAQRYKYDYKRKF